MSTPTKGGIALVGVNTLILQGVDTYQSVGVMKTAMNDIFMHDQQPIIAMITRSSQ